MVKNLKRRYRLWYLVAVLTCVKCAAANVEIANHDISIKLDEKQNIDIKVSDLPAKSEIEVDLVVQHRDIVKVVPSTLLIRENGTTSFEMVATSAGHTEIFANKTDSKVDLSQVFLRVTVFKNAALDTFSLAIGWIYFVAWSVSFYPQIYSNWKRKSVVGLNFDFTALNIIGFSLYGIFNLGLYCIPEVQHEYFDRYPRGLNPVKVNDIVFAVHAAFATLVTIVQCFVYERQDQKVSFTARGIMGVFAAFLTISIILAACKVILWLDFLYYCSYVKLTITLIKYVPQAYMNFKRKSTVGWSIVNVFLDFTGGSLSMLQMIVDSYNYDDWQSIFGDPTKFGLGLFSVAFDIFFILQHYVFYRHTVYEEK